MTVLPVEAQKEEAFLQTRCSVFYKPGATARNSHIKERVFILNWKKKFSSETDRLSISEKIGYNHFIKGKKCRLFINVNNTKLLDSLKRSECLLFCWGVSNNGVFPLYKKDNEPLSQLFVTSSTTKIWQISGLKKDKRYQIVSL